MCVQWWGLELRTAPMTFCFQIESWGFCLAGIGQVSVLILPFSFLNHVTLEKATPLHLFPPAHKISPTFQSGFEDSMK